ncbi:MAG: queuosine precursor transporter [Muribaculaceae bacterium]|nr:queuosine precursor transporter [Muribaculaceae bacterium]
MKQLANRRVSALYLVLVLTFCICLIVANLVEIKTIDLGPLTITAGVIIFPLSYIINDCVVEVYGLRLAKFMIWLGFASSLFVTLALQLSLILPGSAEWTSQAAMQEIYGSVPRIVAASFLAFLCGSMVNAYTMERMKSSGDGVRKFSFRAIMSTVYGESVDSLIFFPVAFAGVLSWRMIVSLMVTQAVIKTMYEVLILPVTIMAVKRLRKMERIIEIENV